MIKPEDIDVREFYELMQTYRHMPIDPKYMDQLIQAYEAVNTYIAGLLNEQIAALGEEGEKGPRVAVTADELYKDRSTWDIPLNVADGGIREQAFWQGRYCGAEEMARRVLEKHGK